MFLRSKVRPVVRLKNLMPSVSWLYRHCGILNISKSYRPARPVTGIAFAFLNLGLSSDLFSSGSPTFGDTANTTLYVRRFLERSRFRHNQTIRPDAVTWQLSRLKGHNVDKITCVWYDHDHHGRSQATSRQFAEWTLTQVNSIFQNPF
jgi:hypothetical protein